MAKRKTGYFAERERQRQERIRQQIRFAKEQERLAAKAKRENERTAREQQRLERQALKEQRELHVVSQQQLAASRTNEVRDRLTELDAVLASALRRGATTTFENLRKAFHTRPFDAGGIGQAAREPQWEDFAPRPPSALTRLLRPRAGDQAIQAARIRFEHETQDHRVQEQSRLCTLGEMKAKHTRTEEARRAEHLEENARIDQFERAYRAGSPAAVERFLTMVLEFSRSPDGFPRRIEVAYQPDPRRLLVLREVPPVAIIPAVREYSYVQTRDEIVERPRPTREIKDRYAALIANLVLRTLLEVFRVRPPEAVSEVAVSAEVSTRSKATGRPERICLVSVQADRAEFDQLVLAELDPNECLRHLNALVSPHPHDLQAVRPVFDPDLSKYRFVTEHDAASRLDGRSVLLEMHPIEFEHLVRQLFEAMGMKSWVTQASRDDGVDAVAVNEDPIMGGLCVIQAKRYRKVVPADAVRALAGVMDDKRASRGVLVTTSWFGKTTHDFKNRHGRIQLIEGPELKHLLQEHLGLDVIVGKLEDR